MVAHQYLIGLRRLTVAACRVDVALG